MIQESEHDQAKWAILQVRIEPDLKQKASRFFRHHDLDTSKGVRMYLRKIIQVNEEIVPGQVPITDTMRFTIDDLARFFQKRHNSDISRMPY